jgi:hypothetical protein
MYLKRVFKKLGDSTTISADANGALWMNFSGEEFPLRVGISASNLFAPDSDGQFAYQIMLARMEDELKSPKHSRETMLDFKQDWTLLADIRGRGLRTAAERNAEPAPQPAGADSGKSGTALAAPASSASSRIQSVAHGGEMLP